MRQQGTALAPALTEFSMEKVLAAPKGVLMEFTTPQHDRTGSLKIAVTDVLGIVDGTMISEQPTRPMQRYNDMPFVEMNFMLEGHILQTYEGLLNGYHYQKGDHNILFNPHAAETNQLFIPGKHNIFSVHIQPRKMAELLAGYLPEMAPFAEKIIKGVPFVLHAPDRYLTSDLKYFFDSFWQPDLPPNVGKLYYESRVMELLARQCAVLLRAGSKQPNIVRTDQEKIYYAREIILNRLSDPPSLSELSKLINLNEFKLKKYFKQIFGVSVFAMLQDERLKQAKQLIFDGEKNISAIAYELGYAHSQHFHRAFRKKFGVTPGSLLK